MTDRRALGYIFGISLALVACSGSEEASQPKCTLEAASVDGGIGPCNVIVAAQPDEGAAHLDKDCLPVSYVSNPPSSGAHYPTWAAYGAYDEAVPRGFWVHSLEHGAVVFSYKPNCTDQVGAAKELMAKLVDPLCADPPRVILTPDPLLDTQWAASAWGFTLRATCFDAAAFESFFNQHVGNTVEKICSPHPNFMTPDALSTKPDGCGS